MLTGHIKIINTITKKTLYSSQMNSFVANFLGWFSVFINNNNTVAGGLDVVNILGNVISLEDAHLFHMAMPAGNDFAGIVIGTDDETILEEQCDNHSLGAVATSLDSEAMIVNQPYADAVTTSMEISRVFSNSSSSITINEIGLVGFLGDIDEYPVDNIRTVLLIRDIITPITVENGESIRVTYTLSGNRILQNWLSILYQQFSTNTVTFTHPTRGDFTIAPEPNSFRIIAPEINDDSNAICGIMIGSSNALERPNTNLVLIPREAEVYPYGTKIDACTTATDTGITELVLSKLFEHRGTETVYIKEVGLNILGGGFSFAGLPTSGGYMPGDTGEVVRYQTFGGSQPPVEDGTIIHFAPGNYGTIYEGNYATYWTDTWYHYINTTWLDYDDEAICPLQVVTPLTLLRCLLSEGIYLSEGDTLKIIIKIQTTT